MFLQALGMLREDAVVASQQCWSYSQQHLWEQLPQISSLHLAAGI